MNCLKKRCDISYSGKDYEPRADKNKQSQRQLDETSGHRGFSVFSGKGLAVADRSRLDRLLFTQKLISFTAL
jgi:hypothetical protein